MSLFESTLLSFCKPQSKFDLPALRQGSRERKNAFWSANIYVYIYISVDYKSEQSETQHANKGDLIHDVLCINPSSCENN